jgi:hypothetical protein
MKLLFVVWTSFLASKLPCPLESYTWSKEHVLPKSLFPQVMVNNRDNIIPLPTKINNGRGNRKYTNKFQDGHIVYTCTKCPFPGYCRGAAIIGPDGVILPEPFRGPVARSVLRSIEKFPKFAEKISKEVLDYDVAIELDRRYPMSIAEHYYRSINQTLAEKGRGSWGA